MARNVFNAIRRKPDHDRTTNNGAASSATLPIRLSGTVPHTLSEYDANPNDAGLGNNNPNGRTGNDWTYPDYPRGRFDVGTVNGDRLQDATARHIHEGPGPGRIPRGWNNRLIGKVGRNITGNPSGDDFAPITITGDSAGGIGDMMYVPHTPTPRGVGIARTYLRTVDDAAPIPGVFLSDPTRH